MQQCPKDLVENNKHIKIVSVKKNNNNIEAREIYSEGTPYIIQLDENLIQERRKRWANQ